MVYKCFIVRQSVTISYLASVKGELGIFPWLLQVENPQSSNTQHL